MPQHLLLLPQVPDLEPVLPQPLLLLLVPDMGMLDMEDMPVDMEDTVDHLPELFLLLGIPMVLSSPLSLQ